MSENAVVQPSSRVVNAASTRVNVWEPPIVDSTSWDILYKPEGGQKQLTLGDQHGNFLKLLYSVLEKGVVSGITDNDYRSLVTLEHNHLEALVRLQDPNLQELAKRQIQQQIAAFDKIIDKLVVNADSQGMLLRLIGDVLADRGSNDYFTLSLIAKLKEKGLKFEVVLSNHDDAYLRPDVILGTAEVNQAISRDNMLLLEQHGLLDQDKVKAIKQTYNASIKLFSYNIEVDSQGVTSLNIFNHAIAGPLCLQNMIQKYPEIFQGITYRVDSIENLCKTIDAVNEKFQQFLSQPEGIARYTAIQQAEENASQVKLNATSTPFWHLIWNRRLQKGDTWQPIEGVVIRTGHGHVGEKDIYQADSGFCLDGDAGKFKDDIWDGDRSLKNPMLCSSSFTTFEAYKKYKNLLFEKFKAQAHAKIADIQVFIHDGHSFQAEESLSAQKICQQLHTAVDESKDVADVQKLCGILDSSSVTETNLNTNRRWHSFSAVFTSLITSFISFFKKSNDDDNNEIEEKKDASEDIRVKGVLKAAEDLFKPSVSEVPKNIDKNETLPREGE